MSLIRDPFKFDIDNKKNTGVNYGEIKKHETEIYRIISECSNIRYIRRKVYEEIDMIVYLLEHEKVNNFKPSTINNLIRRIEEKTDEININLDSLTKHKIGTLTVG